MTRFSRLLTDRVRVRLDPVRKRTVGGILVPDSSDPHIRTGVVLQTGPGRQRLHRRRSTQEYREVFHPIEVREGERVAFLIGSVDTKSGKAVTQYLEDDERMLREDDLLFVIPEGTTVEVS